MHPVYDRSGRKIKVSIPENLPDDQNPKYMFSCIHSSLLSAIVKGEIDPKELAWKELRNRGLNAEGVWVGFEKNAAKKPL